MKSNDHIDEKVRSREAIPPGPVEIDDYDADRPVTAVTGRIDRPPGRDRFGAHGHELTDDAAEAVSRLLVRVVPLTYAGLLGTLAERPVTGLLVGLLATLAFDLRMGPHSLARALVHWLRVGLCPRLAALGRRVGGFARRRGLPWPARSRGLRCA